jgi:hypothetical protein
MRYPEFKDGDDPYDWLTNLYAAFTANNTPESRKLDLLPALLKGGANAWYHNNKRSIKTFGNISGPSQGRDAFTRLFIERFAGQENQFHWCQQLKNRKQGRNESVDSFTEDYLRLSKRADPRGHELGLMKVNNYIGSLRDEIQMHVTMASPKTINEARNKAKAVESAFKIYNRKEAENETDERIRNLEAMVAKTYLVDTNNTSTNTNNNNSNTNWQITCNYCNKKGHKANDCHQKTKDQQQSRGNTQQRIVTCYNCNRTGHIAKDCRTQIRTGNQPSCYKCGQKGHYGNDCNSRNNQNRGNQSYNNQRNQSYNNQRNQSSNNQRIQSLNNQTLKQRNGRIVRTFYANDEEEEDYDEIDTQQQLVEVVSELADKVKHLKV